MFDLELREDIQRSIILEVTLKTLERDREHLGGLKMTEVFSDWYDSKIKEVFEELKSIKKKLYHAGCKIDKGEKVDMFTEYFVLFRGKTEERRYSNITLKNGVTNEMKRLLGMD